MTKSKAAIVFAVLLLLGSAGGADAARLRITDKTNAVIVIDAAYVSYAGGIHRRREQGILVTQGARSVLVDWSKIRDVVLQTSPDGVRLQGTIVLHAGDPLTAELAYGGITGQTSLGTFEITLKDVRHIDVLPDPPRLQIR